MLHSASQFLGYVVASSNNALFFKDHFWEEAQWIPKSQCEIIPTDHWITETHLSIKEWLCGKNGWEEFTEIQKELENNYERN